MPAKHRRVRWMVPLCLFLLTLPAVATRPHSSDEIEYYAFVRSLWFDHDVSFDNEYRYFVDAGYTRDPQFPETFLDVTTATGLRPTFATIGSALLWMPFFAAADAGVRIARAAGMAVRADGFSPPYLTAVAWGSACYGFLAMVLSAALARRLTGRGWGPAIVVAAGTPFIYYMYAQPGFAHACSAFTVALFVVTWMRVRRGWTVGGVAALAALGALMAMVREQDAFIVAGPAVDYGWSLVAATMGTTGAGNLAWRRAVREGAVRLAAAAAAFFAAFTPQALAYLAINGRIGPSPVVQNKMSWTAPWATRVLFSPEHGWFIWTPLAVAAIAGLITMARAPGAERAGTRRLGLLLLIVVATQIYVSGSVASWTLAGAFGQRRFVGITVCLVVGLAWIWPRPGTARLPRVLAGVAAAAAVWWNVGLAMQFGTNRMDRQRLEPARNLRGTFLELPAELPSIAYRYLFDRASFYRAGQTGG